MNRRGYMILLLFLSWVLYNMHRIWNNTQPVLTHPFPLDPGYEITWHWYIYMLLKDLSYLFILWALWLYITRNGKKDNTIIGVFNAVLFVQIIEIPHYLLWARHSEVVLFFEGCILIRSGYKLIRKKY